MCVLYNFLIFFFVFVVVVVVVVVLFFSVKRMLTDERLYSRYTECIDSCLHKFKG